MSAKKEITALSKPSMKQLTERVLSPMESTQQEAARIASRMLGSYPNVSLHDPEIYTDELIKVLMRYPPGVGYKACDAARRTSPDFPPSVGAISKFAEGMWSPTRESLTWSENWDRRAKLQLEEQAREDALRAQTTPEQRKNHVDCAFEEMRSAGFKVGAPKHDEAAMREKAITDFCEKHSITREQYDAISDAAPGKFEQLQRSARSAIEQQAPKRPGPPYDAAYEQNHKRRF